MELCHVTAQKSARLSLNRQGPRGPHVEAADILVPELEDVVGGGDRGEVQRHFVRQDEPAVCEVAVAGVEEGEEAGAREEAVPHPVAQDEVHLYRDSRGRIELAATEFQVSRDFRSQNRSWASYVP